MERPVHKKAMYKGVNVSVAAEDEHYYLVYAGGINLPDGFFLDMDYPGRGEYKGKIRKPAPELEFLE